MWTRFACILSAALLLATCSHFILAADLYSFRFVD